MKAAPPFVNHEFKYAEKLKMTMDLEGAGGEFGATIFGWGRLLRLAQANGWHPMGTVIDESEKGNFPDGQWDSGYQSNDGQKVTAEDALNLANALQSALDDIPDFDALEGKKDSMTGGIVIAPNGPAINNLEWFSGAEGKQFVHNFIVYCRCGEFKIY